MPDGRDQPVLRLADGIAKLEAKAWNACAGADNPSLSHDFLAAMEESGSVGKGTGWRPRPLLLESPDGNLLGAVPLYVKSHSYGEYVFDHGWADAYERAGGRYYPKLLVGVPFTPVPGPRLLVCPGAEAEANPRHLAEGLLAATNQLGVSSLHVNFADAEDSKALATAGFMERVATQYHWQNDGYKTFTDFLANLASRKRKMIRKEREAAAQNGLVLKRLTGDEITPAHWKAFFRFYIDTSERKWGSPYLTRGFFLRIGKTMADRILLVMAEQDGEPVAGALNLIGRDTLYGRNWGSDGAIGSCISRPATTRPSNSLSSGAWRGWKPAPRASIRSAGVIFRSRPAASITSSIAISPPPSPISCGARRRPWRTNATPWPNIRHFASQAISP